MKFNIIRNKVVLYLVTRYLTYFVQFITALFIANKLGPYYLGIWGVYLLVLNYLCNLNFGINNSLNILIVQNINNNSQKEEYIRNSFFLVSLLSILIIIIGVIYYIYNNMDFFAALLKSMHTLRIRTNIISRSQLLMA